MNIGIITYREYETKNIGLNWNFNLSELLRIMLNNKDFVRFEIFDPNNTTSYCQHTILMLNKKGYILKLSRLKKRKKLRELRLMHSEHH